MKNYYVKIMSVFLGLFILMYGYPVRADLPLQGKVIVVDSGGIFACASKVVVVDVTIEVASVFHTDESVFTIYGRSSRWTSKAVWVGLTFEVVSLFHTDEIVFSNYGRSSRWFVLVANDFALWL